jgi:hypothetical protein
MAENLGAGQGLKNRPDRYFPGWSRGADVADCRIKQATVG